MNIHEAKPISPKLLTAVAKGQRITICKDGAPVAQLGPIDTPIPLRRPRLLKGRMTIADGFDAPYGVNSRYWIGPGNPDECRNSIQPIEEVFKRYHPAFCRKLLGDIVSLRFLRFK